MIAKALTNDAYELAAPMIVFEKPSPAELIARAENLLPALRERSKECDNGGRLPDATVRDFEEAGFYKVLQPAKYGGYEYSPKVLFDIVTRLAAACPSSAWCLSVVCVHAWEVGIMGQHVAHDIWGEDSRVRMSSSYSPVGIAAQVDGGYVVNGRWSFSSGCDHCTWALVGALLPDIETGQPQHSVMLIPPGSYRIDPDSWHVLGMRGSGSKDLIVTDAFVPDYRTHFMGDSFQIERLISGQITADTYKYPFRTVFSYCLSSVAIGAADGALKHFAETKKARYAAAGEAERRRYPLNDQRFAEASALIDGAHLRMDRDFAEMTDFVNGTQPIPIEKRASYIWNSAYNAKVMVEAISLLFTASGARAIDESDPMQRYLRDALVLRNHILLNADQKAGDFGWISLGGDPEQINV